MIDTQREANAPLETLVQLAQALSLAKQQRDISAAKDFKEKLKDEASAALTKARDEGRPLGELVSLAQVLSVS